MNSDVNVPVVHALKALKLDLFKPAESQSTQKMPRIKRAAAPSSGPLVTFIYPGFDCS